MRKIVETRRYIEPIKKSGREAEFLAELVLLGAYHSPFSGTTEQIEQHRLEAFAAEGFGAPAETRMLAAENNVAFYCGTLQQPVASDAVAAILRGFAEFVPIEPPRAGCDQV